MKKPRRYSNRCTIDRALGKKYMQIATKGILRTNKVEFSLQYQYYDIVHFLSLKVNCFAADNHCMICHCRTVDYLLIYHGNLIYPILM